jgi:RimJ/RimL family protein N-acetyltransferase
MEMTRLESKRLILRTPTFEDVTAIVQALNDLDISKNLAVVPYPYTEDDARIFVAKAAEGQARGESHCFVIRRQHDDALVGCCGLHRREGAWELGYWIAKPLWRQGYASEAAARLVEFAFDDLDATELMAGWYHDNGVSGLVLARLGFRAVRVEKQHCAARGHDVLCNRTMLTREAFGRKKAPFEASRARHAEEPGTVLGFAKLAS